MAARWGRIAAWVVAAIWLGSGIWAFAAPRSFYDSAATYPPYNVHFLHDMGSFMTGLGAVIVLALLGWSALRATLVGVGIGSALHFVSHVIDYDVRREPVDVIGAAVVTVLAFFAAYALSRPATALDRGR